MQDLLKIKSNVVKMVEAGAPDEEISAYVSAEGVTPEQIKYAGRDYIGKRPGIDDPRLRAATGRAITGLEVLVPLGASLISGGTAGVPAGVISSGAGEYARALTEGKTKKEAAKAGLIGGGIDLGLSLLTGGFGKGATGMVKKKMASELGEEATERVVKNIPKYTKDLKKSYRAVTEQGKSSLINMNKTLGKQVGEAKKAAIKDSSKLVNTTEIKKNVIDMLTQERALGYGGRRGAATSKGVLKKTLDEISNLPEKTDAQTLLDAVNEIDDALESVYKKQIAKGKPSFNEAMAEKIRGITNEKAMSALDEALPASKQKYKEFMNVLNDEGGKIKRALAKQDSFNSLLERSFKDKQWKTLENLQKLDDLLPKKEKFYENFLSKQAVSLLKNIKSPYLSEAGLRTTAFTYLPRIAAKGIRGAASTPGKTLGQLTKTGTRRLLELAGKED